LSLHSSTYLGYCKILKFVIWPAYLSNGDEHPKELCHYDHSIGYILVSSQSGIKECHDIAETVLKLALNTKQSIRIKIKWKYNLNKILF
jgi:hypothetical protein